MMNSLVFSFPVRNVTIGIACSPTSSLTTVRVSWVALACTFVIVFAMFPARCGACRLPVVRMTLP